MPPVSRHFICFLYTGKYIVQHLDFIGRTQFRGLFDTCHSVTDVEVAVLYIHLASVVVSAMYSQSTASFLCFGLIVIFQVRITLFSFPSLCFYYVTLCLQLYFEYAFIHGQVLDRGFLLQLR